MKKLACIQMASGPKVAANLEEAGRLIQIAASHGADMVILPEHFAQMSHDADKFAIAESYGEGAIQDFLAETAQRHKIWLLGGAVPIQAQSDHLRSASLLYNDSGNVEARYDKIHMFDVRLPQSEESYHESEVFEPGDEVVVVDTPLGKLGMSVCYDIRFPELYRSQLAKGMEIIAVPSAFTAVTGKAHWQALLQARAIENQCYLAAAAQGGYHIIGRETHGHSMVIDPWGKIVDCLPSGSGFVITEIDLNRLRSIRQTFPATENRRLI